MEKSGFVVMVASGWIMPRGSELGRPNASTVRVASVKCRIREYYTPIPVKTLNSLRLNRRFFDFLARTVSYRTTFSNLRQSACLNFQLTALSSFGIVTAMPLSSALQLKFHPAHPIRILLNAVRFALSNGLLIGRPSSPLVASDFMKQ